MAKPWAKAFYNSPRWRKCREAFVASRLFLCERCGEPGVEVHHKVELTPLNINDPEITLNWDNLELLCHRCHDMTKRRPLSSTQDGMMFDSSGQLVKVGQVSPHPNFGGRIPPSRKLPPGT